MADGKKIDSKKKRIMEAALRIFAEKGFQNATIAEISKRAGVSEPTVYEHFGTKEALLFAIPEKISTESHEITKQILAHIKSPEEKIRAILFRYFQNYQQNPDYSALVLLQLMANKGFRKTAAHAAIRTSAHRLLECIREGIADGSFRQDIDPYVVRSLLLGAVEHIFIHWHMLGKPAEKSDLTRYLDPIMEIVFEGIRARREDSEVNLKLSLKDLQTLRHVIGIKDRPPRKAKERNRPENRIDGLPSPTKKERIKK